MEIVLRAAAIFVFLFLLLRGMGKRELAELTAFELVILVIMGDLVQQGVTQEDMSVTGAILAVGTMGLLTMALSAFVYRVPRALPLLDGVPLVLVRDGHVIDEALRLEGMPFDELLQAARQEGIGDLADIEICVLEPDGRISFIRTPKDSSDDDDEPSGSTGSDIGRH